MRFTVFFLLLFLSALCGCMSNRELINGEWIEVLSSREQQLLINTARATLSNTKRLTSRDRELIKKLDPELKIRYTGDRTGDANFVWQLPGKRVTLLMRGTFFTPSVQWVMKVHNNPPERPVFAEAADPAVEKN